MKRARSESHCPNGHPMFPWDLTSLDPYKRADGVLVCRMCQRTGQQKFKARLDGPTLAAREGDAKVQHMPVIKRWT